MSPSICWLCNLFRGGTNGITSKMYLEEVLQWSQSFEKLMATKHGRIIYRSYLKTEYSDENIEFWLACENFKKIPSQKKRLSVAQKLFQHYIQPQAPREGFVYEAMMSLLEKLQYAHICVIIASKTYPSKQNKRKMTCAELLDKTNSIRLLFTWKLHEDELQAEEIHGKLPPNGGGRRTSPAACKMINIDSPTREAIIMNIQKPTPSCFDEAQKIVYLHMERDSYPRFLGSEIYQNLIQGLSARRREPSVSIKERE